MHLYMVNFEFWESELQDGRVKSQLVELENLNFLLNFVYVKDIINKDIKK